MLATALGAISRKNITFSVTSIDRYRTPVRDITSVEYTTLKREAVSNNKPTTNNTSPAKRSDIGTGTGARLSGAVHVRHKGLSRSWTRPSKNPDPMPPAHWAMHKRTHSMRQYVHANKLVAIPSFAHCRQAKNFALAILRAVMQHTGCFCIRRVTRQSHHSTRRHRSIRELGPRHRCVVRPLVEAPFRAQAPGTTDRRTQGRPVTATP